MEQDSRAHAGSATLADPVVGHLLDGRYRIGPRIARGGMASVYEAVDIRLDRVCAVKIMHSGLGDDGAFVERFRREARAAARLSHPARRQRLRPGRGPVRRRRHPLPGHGADPGPHPARRHPRRGTDVAGQGAGADGARRVGPRRRPPLRADPPRHQAGERPDRPRRAGQGRRLRPGQGGQRRHAAHRHRRGHHRHGVLPGPRARRRRHQRRARRRVRRGRRPLRAAHRSQAARGRVPDRGGLQARPRGRATAVAPGSRRPGVRRRAGRPGDGPRPRPAAGRRRGAAPPGSPRLPGPRRRRLGRRGADRRPRSPAAAAPGHRGDQRSRPAAR